ncbi:hypothetical protein, partial [Conexibacter sp. W3-3-2]|uniref:hypothetical protein n=1 Tax=Conexibacter sp. W3-3-2 TaxID=2675227 RepID=UPI001E3C93CF
RVVQQQLASSKHISFGRSGNRLMTPIPSSVISFSQRRALPLQRLVPDRATPRAGTGSRP